MPPRLKDRLARLVPRTRRQRWLVAVVLLLAAAWVVVPQLFVPMIRGKLQGMISGHLDAKLHIGRLMYAPPFGVRARDVRLVSGAGAEWPNTELLKVRKLDLKLARSPFREGPLVIQNITVHDPEVHLIRTHDGRLVGMHALVKKDSPTAQPQTHPATQPAAATRPAGPGNDDNELDIDTPEEAEQDAARAKLSDMFQLRHFGVHGGRVVYQDQTRPDLPAVVWKDLNVGMETTPQAKAVYGYTLDARHGDLAALKSSGSFDLDQLLLDLGSLHVDAKAKYNDGDDESPLPAQVQRVLRDYQVEGRVVLDADGRFEVRNPKNSTFRATVDLRDASAYSPEWDATLDRLAVKLSIDNQSASPTTTPGAPSVATGATSGGSSRPADLSEPNARTPSPAGTGPAADPATTSPTVSVEPSSPKPVRIGLDIFEASSGDSSLRLSKGEIFLDRHANAWALSEIAGKLDLGRETSALPKKSRPVLAGMGARGDVEFTVAANGKLRPKEGEYFLIPEDLAVLVYPRGVRLQPKSPAPIENLGGGGSVRKDRGTRVVVAEDLTFTYGGDPAMLTSARLLLPKHLPDLRKQTRIEEISGQVDFRRPGPRYPGKFGKVIDNLRPVGPFTVGRDSWFAVTKVEPDLRIRTDPAAPPRTPPSRKSDWYFSVATDSGSFTLTDDRIPLTNMTGDATVSNLLIDVRRLEADTLGGKLTGTVQITPGRETKYQGRAYLRGVDLDAVSKVYILPETKDAKLTGEGNLDVEFAGVDPDDGRSPLDTLRAAGEFEVLGGHFWTIPLLGEVARRAGGGREMTVGEAAGLFEYEEKQILLRQAAVSSPALGVQGSGTISLDRHLDLNLVAAPLGDWRDKFKGTNVPILSDVAGELAGAIQGLVNGATRGLLYEFRITGTTGDPSVATVPVPALSDTAAALFGGMLRNEKDSRLLDQVRGKRADRADNPKAPRPVPDPAARPPRSRPRPNAGS